MGCNCGETRRKLASEVRRGNLRAAAATVRMGTKAMAAHLGRKLKPPPILKRR